MNSDIKVNNQLICLKTGSKAKIINFFEKDNVPYAKISVDIKFGDTSFQILRSLQVDDIKDQYNYS
tara:strand:- start:69 stop:266 length:198 start_codon:yes stop_codon:yes gene_type:complete